MKDKIVLITGGTGGIGQQTAIALARLGAHVVITGRNAASGGAAAEAVRQQSGNPQVRMIAADLSTRSGIDALMTAFKQSHARLDVLINNAGVAEPQRSLTADGIETNFAVNVLAPYRLARGLIDCLRAAPGGRVVTLTGGEHPAKIDTGNMQGERAFNGLTAYSHAKLLMMAAMREHARQNAGTGVTFNVCYPGQASTRMTQSVTADMMPGAFKLLFPLFKLATRPDGGKSAAKASRCSVYLASSPDVAGVNGAYFNPACKQVPWPAALNDAAACLAVWETVQSLAD